MLMAHRLTPDILAGKSYTETIEFDLNGEVFGVEIRPLTHTEKKFIQSLEQASVKVNSKNANTSAKLVTQSYEVNAGDLVRDQGKAHLKTVALATVDPAWNEDNIDQLWKSEWVEQAYERIAEISGLQVKLPDSFRPKQ
jgi:hypothetical protein